MLTRRALSALLSLALLFSLLSAPARAADGDYEDENYSFDASTGTLSIKKTYFDENFQVDDDAVRYVYIASGVAGLPAGGSAFFRFPNLIAIEVDEGNSYYFAQDGVLLTRNYDNKSQELRSYTLISYPRGKTDPFTVPEKADEILPNAFKEVTGATIYVSRGVDNYVVNKLQKLGSGFAVVSLGGTVSAASVELRQNGSAVPAGQSFTLNIGGELAFSAAVSPENASQEVFWTSSDSDVVTVNSSGTVTARSAGTATLTVSTAELVGNQHLTASCAVTVRPEPTGVTISGGDAALRPGDKTTLTAAVSPAGALQDVTWSSGDETVATVDSNTGEVTAVASGEAVITAKSTRDQSVSGTKTITVTPVKVQTLTLNHDALTVEVTDTAQLTATAAPADAADKSVSWTSSNDDVATVDSSGKVTAVAMGEATVTATAKDGSGVKATCAVTVPEAKINALTMNIATLKLRIDSNQTAAGSHTLTVTFDPAYATCKDLTWQSLNTNVATVTADPNDATRATVTAVDSGIVTILASSSHGKNQETVTASCVVTVEKAADSLTVTPEDLVSLIVNGADGEDSAQYTATVPAGTTDSVEWSSNNEAIATVDSTGKVTALDNGEAIITARCGSLSANRTVSVTVLPVSVRLNKDTLFLVDGGSETLTATVAPTNATDKSVSWSSSDPNVATVSETGLVTAVSPGTATITVTTVSGSKTASCTVTVGDRQIASLSLPESLDVYLNGSGTYPASKTLTLSVSPADATGSILWTNGNPDAVSLSEPVYTTEDNTRLGTVTVTAVGGGKSVISVAADNGKAASCTVSVKVLATGVTLDQSALSLEQNATAKLTASLAPVTVTNPALTWSSDNESVATVSGGVVTAVAPGIAHITAAATDGSGKVSEACTVTVTEIAVTGVRLTPQRLVMRVGDTPVSLSAAVTPANAANTAVSWISSNNNVATVNDSGAVTAVGPGEAEITVKTTDGNFTAVCYVTVAATPVTSLTLDRTSIDVLLREVTGPVTLTATVLPDKATDKSVVWSSSNETVATVAAGNSDGTAKVTLRAVGSAVITARSVSNGTVYRVCPVTVRPTSVEAVSLSAATLELEPGGTANLAATLTSAVENVPPDNTAVTWSSSNPNVATVDSSGHVTAVASGSAAVTVLSAEGGKSATCLVKVWRKVTGVTLSSESLPLNIGESQTLTATVAPSEAENRNLRWSSSNEAVATVDAAGRVVARSAGTATVTVTLGDRPPATCAVTVANPATGVVLDNAALTLTRGGTKQLVATVLPADATEKIVTWSSNDETVATVSSSGLVTAVASGTATVTATANGHSAPCAVTVEPVKVSAVTMDTARTLTLGGSATLSPDVMPTGADNRELLWESGNEAVAFVDQTGQITARGVGTAIVTATAKDGSGSFAACLVTVEPVAVTGFATEPPATLSLTENESRQLSAAVNADATDQALRWHSSNETVATVDATGNVTAHSAGTAILTVTAHGNESLTASCTVTVTAPLTGLSLPAALSLKTEETATLSPVFTPGNASNTAVTWRSGNENIATVDANGVVTAVGPGTVNITVAAAADESLTAACAVTVTRSVTGVTLADAATPLTLDMSATATLSATVAPPDASDKTLSWSSTNPAVATVENGVVTPVAPGTTAILVTTADGGFFASRTVNVVRAASGVTLTPTSLSLAVGHGAQLTAAVTGDATDTGIKWRVTSDPEGAVTVTDSGYVTALHAGTATVTATTADGSNKSASCAVTVYAPVSAVAIQKAGAPVTSLTLNLVTGRTAQLTAVTTGGAPTLQWSAEGDAVTVDDSGLVTAQKAGTAVVTVTATTQDVSLSARCAVTVEKAILTADKTAVVLTPNNRSDSITFSPWRVGSSLEWRGAVDSVTRSEGEADSSFNKLWTISALQNGVYTVSWLRSGDDNYEASGGELTIYAVPHPITAVSLTTTGAATASVDQQERRINIAGTYTGDAKPAYTLSYTLATDVLGTLSCIENGNSVTVQNGDDTVCEYTIVDNRAALPENVTVSTQVSLMAEPGKVVDSGSVDITAAAAANLNAAAVGKVVSETQVDSGDVQVRLNLTKSVATESGNQVLKLEILPTYTTTAGGSGELHELDAAVEISVTVNFKPTLIVHRHVAQDGSVSYEYPYFTATPNDESGGSYTVTWQQKRFSTVDLLPEEAAAAYMESLNTTLPPETPEEAEQPGDHTDDSTGNKPGDNTAGSKETGAGNNSTGSSGGITGGGGVHNGSSSGSASRKPAEPAAPATKPAVPSVPEVKADNVRSFLDVPESHWAREAIAYVSARGIINGMSLRTFAPELSASRAMIAQILRNLDGGAQEGASPFPDTAGKWFDAAAAWAAAKGVVNGVGGRFDGDTPVTREQLAVMLYRYAALIGKADGNAAELSRFRDAESVSPWAAEAMAWAVGRGLINGVSPATLSPHTGATRAQTAAILMRFCENVLK